MEPRKKIDFDLGQISQAFQLTVARESPELNQWLASTSTLTEVQAELLDQLHEEVKEDGGYWNEEELKVQFVGLILRIADVVVKNKLKVFYERPLAATVNGYALSVVSDCLMAAPLPFNTPAAPFFFLQEFKKKRGEKKDPEAQMLIAMLIAQALNPSGQILYGGYLIGPNWHFATLNGQYYTTSRQYDATNRDDLYQIVYIIRQLRELVA
jgi:predicted house-cleaning noncanonical NTP pyrophosphatase (MazG superfamily)